MNLIHSHGVWSDNEACEGWKQSYQMHLFGVNFWFGRRTKPPQTCKAKRLDFRKKKSKAKTFVDRNYMTKYGIWCMRLTNVAAKLELKSCFNTRKNKKRKRLKKKPRGKFCGKNHFVIIAIKTIMQLEFEKQNTLAIKTSRFQLLRKIHANFIVFEKRCISY